MPVLGPGLQHRAAQLGCDGLGLAQQTRADALTAVLCVHTYHHARGPRLRIGEMIDARRTEDEAVALRETSDHRAIRLILPRGQNLRERQVIGARAMHVSGVRIAQLPHRLEVHDLRRIDRVRYPDGADGDIDHVSTFFHAPL